MSKRGKTTNSTIERVFKFYSDHKLACNSSYDLANEQSIDKIYENIRDEKQINSLLTITALVIITANKYERNILHQNVFKKSGERIKSFKILLNTADGWNNGIFVYYFQLHGYSVLHFHANVTGANTIGGSADIVRWIENNDYLYPSVIISFGLCFGTYEEKEEIGDVIISKKVYPYFVGVKLKGEKLEVSDDNVLRIDDRLNQEICKLLDDNSFTNLDFNVFFKNYITGEAVLSSKPWRRKFTMITTQEIFAGDMEAYGLFKESRSWNYKTPCFVLKSICDWGEEKNFDPKDENTVNMFTGITKIDKDTEGLLSTLKDRLQAYSSNCAFDVLDIILEKEIFHQSVFKELEKRITDYIGQATTCWFLYNYLLELNNVSINGYSISKRFLHRSIMLLDEKGMVQCEAKCKQHNNNVDACLAKTLNTSVTLTKVGG